MHVIMLVTNPVTFDQRVINQAKVLQQNGYTIQILGWDRYSRFSAEETVYGLPVKRFRNSALIRFIPIQPFQIHFFLKKAVAYIKTRGTVDVVHCHDLDTLKAGIAIKKRTHCKLVYDSHEIYLNLLKRGRGKYTIPYYKHIERKGAGYVDKLIVADVRHKDYFYQQYGYSDIGVVRNTKEIDQTHYQVPSDGLFHIVYIGTISGPRYLLETIEVMQDIPDAKLTLAGPGPLQDKVSAAAASKPNVEYIGVVPVDRIIEKTRHAHAVLCMIDPSDQNNRMCPANKQFEAMVAGRPIIATKGTRVAEITREQDCGVIVDFDKQALKAGIIRLKNDRDLQIRLGKNALKSALEKYNWSIDAENLLRVYQEL